MRTNEKLDVLFEELAHILGCDDQCEERCVFPEVGTETGCPINQFRAAVDYTVRLKLAVEAVGPDVMREEGNCEDAVNGIAYEAYQRLYGDTPISEMKARYVHELAGAARQLVKHKGHAYGIEWEEF